MGGASSQPQQSNTQALIVSQGEYTNVTLHDDTVFYVVCIVVFIALAALAYYLYRRYQKHRHEARPARAMARIQQLQMQPPTYRAPFSWATNIAQVAPAPKPAQALYPNTTTIQMPTVMPAATVPAPQPPAAATTDPIPPV